MTAEEVEAAGAAAQAGTPRDPVALPDAKLLTALDRLGFSLEHAAGMDRKTIMAHYRELARRFHPDVHNTQDQAQYEADKAFYEDQMKKLNEAKDFLLARLGR